MSTVLINIALSLIMVAIGLLVGWWLRGGKPVMGASDDQRRSREVLCACRSWPRTLPPTWAHSSRVEEINQELLAAGGRETEAVVSAVAKLIQANQQMQQQLDTAEDRLQEQVRLVQTHAAEARTDALTGLANRRAFDDALARRWAEFQRPAGRFPSSWVISTISRSSTTSTATRSATRCCGEWPESCGAGAGNGPARPLWRRGVRRHPA